MQDLITAGVSLRSGAEPQAGTESVLASGEQAEPVGKARVKAAQNEL